MNRSILVIVSYLIIKQAHGRRATKEVRKELETRIIKWERFDREGWAFDCDLGKIREKMDLSDFYPEEEMETVGEKNLSVHKMRDFRIGTSQLLKIKPTDTAMIIQNLLTEGLVYMEAIVGKVGRGKLLILRKDKVYLISCIGVRGEKVGLVKGKCKKCYTERPIKHEGKTKFINKVTKIIQSDSEEVECNSNRSLFQSLKQAVNDQELIEFSNKEVTFSLWKDKKFSRDIAKLLNKQSALNLIRIEEGSANGDLSGEMIITRIQLFLRMNAAKIAITWGVIEAVVILGIVIAARTFGVKWWRIATILSTIAKIYNETMRSCLQAKLDERAKEVRNLKWNQIQIVGNDEAGSKKKTYKEHVHDHLDQIYNYINAMVPRLGEYERINKWESSRNRIDMRAVRMNSEIVIGVQRQMEIITRRIRGTVNETEKKEDGKDSKE